MSITINWLKKKKCCYALAILLSPKLFRDAKILIVDTNLVPHGKSNQFYKITDDRIGFHVNEEIVIGGRVVRVLNVMAYTTQWINTYYNGPLERWHRLNSSSNTNY